MSLPKINTPEYTLHIPSSDEEIKFRPFLVKEEKVLLIAQETGGEQALYHAIKNLVSSCCFGKVDVDALPLFDIVAAVPRFLLKIPILRATVA